MSIIVYFIDHIDKIYRFTVSHLALISIAMFFSLLLWVSVGVIIRNKKNLARGILGVGSLIMAVPSISLYGILMTIPGFGLSRRSAVCALVLYSMIPIVRNVYTALNEVDDSILEAARGMGMPPLQVLFKIELPLALPVIIAGVQTSAVVTVGTAIISDLIGGGGLGRMVFTGLAMFNPVKILIGSLLAAIIAIILDRFFDVLEKKMSTPRLYSK
ncbi:ABC transporter permease [Halothermothrix orenii]|uniref:Binding-protein-dependent transport systems inner membrane component n=1 Tax=Halothermothrix orenii (strain H 168 / OCM 544 / DSM 9562) TaxID=373903 RepID=B8CZ73_HALOH|nr:ABC transporter permease [Halothermothrix orenii]ACL70592.1 binding-protein-dependent transport systems inner membrane component [Halothermothrix orenii H 168]